MCLGCPWDPVNASWPLRLLIENLTNLGFRPRLSRARYAGSLRQRRYDAVGLACRSRTCISYTSRGMNSSVRLRRTSKSPGGERAPDGPLVLEERQEARRELDGRRRQLADEVVACAQINSESGGSVDGVQVMGGSAAIFDLCTGSSRACPAPPFDRRASLPRRRRRAPASPTSRARPTRRRSPRAP